LLDTPVATYRSIVESEAYSLQLTWFLYGVLEHFDLPDLVGSLAPRRCWLLNASSTEAGPLPESKLAAVYHHAIEAYQQANAEEGLQFLVRMDGERPSVLDKWLKTA